MSDLHIFLASLITIAIVVGWWKGMKLLLHAVGFPNKNSAGPGWAVGQAIGPVFVVPLSFACIAIGVTWHLLA